VLLVSAGTLLSARGAYSEAPTAEAGWLAVGCAALVGGTALHAGMFVFSERAMRLGGLHPFLLSSGMGAAETAALAAWNGALLSRHGPQLYAPHDGEVELGTVALLYAGLTLVNAMRTPPPPPVRPGPLGALDETGLTRPRFAPP